MRRSIAALALITAFFFGLGLASGAAAQGLGCAGYADQQGAQLILDSGSDANLLDPDGNHIACEDFFGGDTPTAPVVDPADVTGSDDLPPSGDASGGDQANDASGNSGVVVGAPVAPDIDTSVDGGTAVEGGNDGTANTGTIGTTPEDTGAVAGEGDVAGTDETAGAADTGETAALDTAAVPVSAGVANLPVTSSVGSTVANKTVATLPNTGAGPAAASDSLPVLALLGAALLLGGAGVVSRRRL